MVLLVNTMCAGRKTLNKVGKLEITHGDMVHLL